jgi:hypothetical protein
MVSGGTVFVGPGIVAVEGDEAARPEAVSGKGGSRRSIRGGSRVGEVAARPKPGRVLRRPRRAPAESPARQHPFLPCGEDEPAGGVVM